MTRIWWILIGALSSLKNLNFDGCLWYKVKNVWPKKVQRSYILWHWRTMQNLKKLTCGLENDTRNLANFHQNTWKCQDWYFQGILLSKVENEWTKNLRTVMCNNTEEWWKIWRGIGSLVQNWYKECYKFWLENSKVSKIYTLLGCFWPNSMFELEKKYIEVALECDAKFEETLTCDFENDTSNLENFHQTPQKSQKWDFHWFFLYKVENAWA